MKSILLLSAVLTIPAFADFKFGTVDLQKALQTVEAGKNAKSALEKEVMAKKSDLEKAQQAFQKEAEQFEKKAAILSESAKTQKQAELQKKYVEIQKSMQETQMDIQKRERDLTKPIIDELRAIIEGIATEKSYDLVVEKNEGGVLYAKADADLTEQVIERFNARNKGKSKGKK